MWLYYKWNYGLEFFLTFKIYPIATVCFKVRGVSSHKLGNFTRLIKHFYFRKKSDISLHLCNSFHKTVFINRQNCTGTRVSTQLYRVYIILPGICSYAAQE